MSRNDDTHVLVDDTSDRKTNGTLVGYASGFRTERNSSSNKKIKDSFQLQDKASEQLRDYLESQKFEDFFHSSMSSIGDAGRSLVIGLGQAVGSSMEGNNSGQKIDDSQLQDKASEQLRDYLESQKESHVYQLKSSYMALDAKIRANGRWSNPESDPKLQSLIVSRDTILRTLMEACSKEDMCLFDVEKHPADNEQGQKKGGKKVIKSAFGRPIGNKTNSLTAGPRGPMLLQDMVYIEEISHFDRERIPERVVHAKGNGAFGYFEVTDDVSKYTRAKVFCDIGKRTPVAVRFSLAAQEKGGPDTNRDLRGFAIKFYTEEGNWDLVGIHVPVFPIRDPISFPSFAHALKKNPVTNLRDLNMAWDIFSLRPEGVNLLMYFFSDQGIPETYRNMDGFGVNTFKLVNDSGEVFYCKFSYLTDQGRKFIFTERAVLIGATEPDYHGRDLYNAIENGKFPSWTFYIQVMTPEQAKDCRFNPFDPTKLWPESEYPMIRVGKLLLNKNPSNHFAEVEQIAFSPGNFVPGIEASPDKILQGRIFSYVDTQRYRLGTNFFQLPINCPFRSRPRNYERDGTATVTDNQNGAPNYFPNSFGGPVEEPRAEESTFLVHGEAARYDFSDDDNYSQARVFYRQLSEDEKLRLVSNIVLSLSNAEQFIQDRAIAMFTEADPDLGTRLRVALQAAQLLPINPNA